MASKRLKKLKKRYDLGGNMSTQGISNDNVNKPHIYLDAAGRTLAGIAQGLGNVVGLGSVIQAGNDAMGVSDQLNKSREYKTASGITSGIAGMGMNIAGMFGGMGKKNTGDGITPPDTTVTDTGYATPELTPDNTSVEITDLQNNGYNVWNAYGGRMYPNGGTLPTYDELNAWNDYLKGMNADLQTQGLQPSYLDDKANFGYAQNYYDTFAANKPFLKGVSYNDFVKKMQTYGNDVYMSNNNATTNKQKFQQNTSTNTPNTATNVWGRSNPDGIVGSYTLQQYIPTYNVTHNSNTGSVSGDVKAMYNPYDATNPYSIVSNTLQSNGQPVTNQQLMNHWNGTVPLNFTSNQPTTTTTRTPVETDVTDDYMTNTQSGANSNYNGNMNVVNTNTIPTVKTNTNTNTNPVVNTTDINNVNNTTVGTNTNNLSDKNPMDVQALWEVRDGRLVNVNAQQMYGRDESYTISPQTQKKTYHGTRLVSGDKKYAMGDNGEVYLIQAHGGEMLTEFNGGGTHEMNPLGGIPVGPNSLVEQDETKFTPINKNQPEFIFSEREKDKDTGKSFAKLSKQIKNKYKLRPHDSMSKESMNKELGTLADKQEAQKQEKAMKLMQQAMELSPEMFQDQGINQGIMNDQSMMEMPQDQMGQGMMMGSGGIHIKPENRGKFTASAKAHGMGVQAYASHVLNNPNATALQKKRANFARNAAKWHHALGGNMYAWGGGTNPPTVNDLFVGPQLHNKQQPPYSLGDIYSTPDIYSGQTTLEDLNTGYNPAPKNQDVFYTDPNTNPTGSGNGDGTQQYQNRMLFETDAPNDYTGAKAGMFGLQALGESMRLGMTPNSRLTGNIKLDRVNPYLQQLIAEQQANQQRSNYMNAVRGAGLNPSQYLAAITTGLGDMNIGNTIAGINAQGQLTNAGIQHQEAQINKNLELQRNDIIAQDIANKSNQMGAVGAGLTQNMSGVLTDVAKKDMDMFSLPFVATKENYQLKYNPETGKYEYYYVPSKFPDGGFLPVDKDEKGNKRKKVPGTNSTEVTIGITGTDGKYYNIPTVVDGVQLSDDDAIKHFEKTGFHMGVYDTQEAADQGAMSREKVNIALGSTGLYGNGGVINNRLSKLKKRYK